MQLAAIEMMKALDGSTPTPRAAGEWHLPYVDGYDRGDLVPAFQPREFRYEELRDENENQRRLAQISSARCARVSYLTHDGKRDPIEDVKLADRLLENGHMSPFEHAARCAEDTQPFGNFNGWQQYRKLIPDEAVHKRR